MASDGGRALSVTSHAAEETEALGERLGRALSAPAVIALDGDLGAGKTCFVRGLARGLGVSDPVSSPTYALLQSYDGRLPLHHLDAWMEGRERAFLLDGGLEWIAERGVTVIEWAERVADLLPPDRISVRIERSSADLRVIHIALLGPNAGAGPLAQVLETVVVDP